MFEVSLTFHELMLGVFCGLTRPSVSRALSPPRPVMKKWQGPRMARRSDVCHSFALFADANHFLEFFRSELLCSFLLTSVGQGECQNKQTRCVSDDVTLTTYVTRRCRLHPVGDENGEIAKCRTKWFHCVAVGQIFINNDDNLAETEAWTD